MGLFDWIGESIGGAFNALAEFIGDALEKVLKGSGKLILGIAGDFSKDLTAGIFDDENPVRKDAKGMLKELEKPLEEGFLHDIKEADKKHSETSPDDIDDIVMGMWNNIRRDRGIIGVGLVTAEVMSLGQIDRVIEVINIADKLSGVVDFASTLVGMKYKAQFFDSYQRYLNRRYPNKIAGTSDLISFALREVWDVTRRPELLAETPPIEYYQFMEQQGYPPKRADDWWAAHWVLPSVGQLNEMLHRRVITPEEWDRFVKYNDFDPTVRPWLKAISYKPYTRVDTRRMWDLAQLSEQEVFDNYQDLGYDTEHAEKMTIWTKIYVLAVELRARYSKGWISAEDVKREIIAAGMPADRAEIWVQKIVRNDQEERLAPERDLTKAEIVKGVKNGFLTIGEGIELLVDMGYDEAEAEYIILINVEAMGGSPQTLEEFQNIVNKRRKALGLPIRKKKPKTEKTGTGSGKTLQAPTSKLKKV